MISATGGFGKGLGLADLLGNLCDSRSTVVSNSK